MAVKLSVYVPAGDTEGAAADMRSRLLVFVGFPVDPNTGKVKHTATRIGFDGSFDGQTWSTVNDGSGQPLYLQARPVQQILGPADSFRQNFQGNAIMPVPAVFVPFLWEWRFLRVRLEKPEKDRLDIDFYAQGEKLNS